MNSHFLRSSVLVGLVTTLTLTPFVNATTAPHWAQAQLSRAQQDGYLTGNLHGDLCPEDTITTAQMLTVLCRVLEAQKESAVNVDVSAWYYREAAQAAYLQLAGSRTDFDAPLSRLDAFCKIAEAFQLTDSTTDTACLAPFPETIGLAPSVQADIATLINRGYVQGSEGSLHLSETLTRAEFITILYRVLDSGYISSEGQVSDFTGENLWLTCSTADIALDNVQADRVVIRSQQLGDITLQDCDIGQLVIAGDGNLTLDLPAQDVTIGTGSGKVDVICDSLQVMDDSRQITVGEGTQQVTVNGYGNTLTTDKDSALTTVNLNGTSNTLRIAGTVEDLNIRGAQASVTGEGSVENIHRYAPECYIDIASEEVLDVLDYGLTDTVVAMQGPGVLPVETTLNLSAVVQNLEMPLENCTAIWTMEGKELQRQTLTLSPNQPLTLSHKFTYTKDMPLQVSFGLTLQYTTAYGDFTSAYGYTTVQLENYPPSHYEALTKDAILAKVTNQYLGDFTLAWAEANDYTPAEKEAWISAKGYTSATPYLIWVNEAYQRCNVFDMTGSKPKLIHEFMVACGKGDNTPSLVTVTTTKQNGWFTDHYVCKPIVRFLPNSGFAFHSRLYYPSGNGIMDATIGMPASAGCIRMLEADIQYIYDVIPSGTRVITF